MPRWKNVHSNAPWSRSPIQAPQVGRQPALNNAVGIDRGELPSLELDTTYQVLGEHTARMDNPPLEFYNIYKDSEENLPPALELDTMYRALNEHAIPAEAPHLEIDTRYRTLEEHVPLSLDLDTMYQALDAHAIQAEAPPLEIDTRYRTLEEHVPPFLDLETIYRALDEHAIQVAPASLELDSMYVPPSRELDTMYRALGEHATQFEPPYLKIDRTLEEHVPPSLELDTMHRVLEEDVPPSLEIDTMYRPLDEHAIQVEVPAFEVGASYRALEEQVQPFLELAAPLRALDEHATQSEQSYLEIDTMFRALEEHVRRSLGLDDTVYRALDEHVMQAEPPYLEIDTRERHVPPSFELGTVYRPLHEDAIQVEAPYLELDTRHQALEEHVQPSLELDDTVYRALDEHVIQAEPPYLEIDTRERHVPPYFELDTLHPFLHEHALQAESPDLPEPEEELESECKEEQKQRGSDQGSIGFSTSESMDNLRARWRGYEASSTEENAAEIGLYRMSNKGDWFEIFLDSGQLIFSSSSQCTGVLIRGAEWLEGVIINPKTNAKLGRIRLKLVAPREMLTQYKRHHKNMYVETTSIREASRCSHEYEISFDEWQMDRHYLLEHVFESKVIPCGFTKETLRRLFPGCNWKGQLFDNAGSPVHAIEESDCMHVFDEYAMRAAVQPNIISNSTLRERFPLIYKFTFPQRSNRQPLCDLIDVHCPAGHVLEGEMTCTERFLKLVHCTSCSKPLDAGESFRPCWICTYAICQACYEHDLYNAWKIELIGISNSAHLGNFHLGLDLGCERTKSGKPTRWQISLIRAPMCRAPTRRRSTRLSRTAAVSVEAFSPAQTLKHGSEDLPVREQSYQEAMSGPTRDGIVSQDIGDVVASKSLDVEDKIEVWQVSNQCELLQVRSAPSFSSAILTTKAKGSFIHGYKIGGWVRLVGEPGCIAIGDDSRKVGLCRKSYKVVWWEVVKKCKLARVMAAPSYAADLMSNKCAGSNVQGYQIGGWVHLVGEPGYIAIAELRKSSQIDPRQHTQFVRDVDRIHESIQQFNEKFARRAAFHEEAINDADSMSSHPRNERSAVGSTQLRGRDSILRGSCRREHRYANDDATDDYSLSKQLSLLRCLKPSTVSSIDIESHSYKWSNSDQSYRTYQRQDEHSLRAFFDSPITGCALKGRGEDARICVHSHAQLNAWYHSACNDMRCMLMGDGGRTTLPALPTWEWLVDNDVCLHGESFAHHGVLAPRTSEASSDLASRPSSRDESLASCCFDSDDSSDLHNRTSMRSLGASSLVRAASTCDPDEKMPPAAVRNSVAAVEVEKDLILQYILQELDDLADRNTFFELVSASPGRITEGNQHELDDDVGTIASTYQQLQACRAVQLPLNAQSDELLAQLHEANARLAATKAEWKVLSETCRSDVGGHAKKRAQIAERRGVLEDLDKLLCAAHAQAQALNTDMAESSKTDDNNPPDQWKCKACSSRNYKARVCFRCFLPMSIATGQLELYKLTGKSNKAPPCEGWNLAEKNEAGDLLLEQSHDDEQDGIQPEPEPCQLQTSGGDERRKARMISRKGLESHDHSQPRRFTQKRNAFISYGSNIAGSGRNARPNLPKFWRRDFTPNGTIFVSKWESPQGIHDQMETPPGVFLWTGPFAEPATDIVYPPRQAAPLRGPAGSDVRRERATTIRARKLSSTVDVKKKIRERIIPQADYRGRWFLGSRSLSKA